MWKKLVPLWFATLLVAMVFGINGVARAECAYLGESNGLPTAGAPVVLYANGDTAPSGHVGVSDGTADNYGQVSGDAGGVQFEGRSSTAGQGGYANSGGEMGSC